MMPPLLAAIKDDTAVDLPALASTQGTDNKLPLLRQLQGVRMTELQNYLSW